MQEKYSEEKPHDAQARSVTLYLPSRVQRWLGARIEMCGCAIELIMSWCGAAAARMQSWHIAGAELAQS